MLTLPGYPRTLHIGSSGGRASRHSVEFRALAGRHLVVEEKIDGSHAGVCFSSEAELVVFSRKTVLTKALAPKSFWPLIDQAERHEDALFDRLGTRYVLYGEWVHTVHAIFYDALPALFVEDDVFDREAGVYLDTPNRRALLAGLPSVFGHSVPVLHEGELSGMDALVSLHGPSRFKTSKWRSALSAQTKGAEVSGLDDSDEAEGLYVKVEEGGKIEGRYKWIRPSFLSNVLAADEHWSRRQPLMNRVAGHADGVRDGGMQL